MKKIVLWIALSILLTSTACGGGAPTLPAATPTSQNLAPTIAPSPTTIPSPTPVPPTATPDPSANPLASLTHAFNGWLSAKTFRAHITSTTGKTTTESLLEVVAPDRFHLTRKGSEVIKIGNDIYVKTGTTWRKMTNVPGLDFSLGDAKKIQEELGLSTDTKFVGAEVLDGTPTFVYQYVTTIKTPPDTSTTKVWIGATDGLPRKTDSLSKSGTHTVTLYTDYNANISIEAPIK